MGTSDNFCLRWNDFETNISTSFRELRRDSEFFDVTLCCDNGSDRVSAHKVILAACSPLFRRILHNNAGSTNPLLYLKGIQKKELTAILNFMYHGEVNVAQDSLNAFLAVAEELAVKGLTTDSKPDGFPAATPGGSGVLADDPADPDFGGSAKKRPVKKAVKISRKRVGEETGLQEGGSEDVKRIKPEPDVLVGEDGAAGGSGGGGGGASGGGPDFGDDTGDFGGGDGYDDSYGGYDDMDETGALDTTGGGGGEVTKDNDGTKYYDTVEMCKILSTSRGRPLLLDSGNHRYRQLKYNPEGTIIYWACLKEKSKRCKVRLHTTKNFCIIKVRGRHTHAADSAGKSSNAKVEYVNLLTPPSVGGQKKQQQQSSPPAAVTVKRKEKEKSDVVKDFEKEIEVISFLGQKEATKDKAKDNEGSVDPLQQAIESIDQE